MTKELVEVRLAAVAQRYATGQHPECRPGELLLCNVMKEEVNGWATARVGEVAYRDDGTVIEDFKPLFAQITEVEAAPEGVDTMGTITIERRKIVPYAEAGRWQLALKRDKSNLPPLKFTQEHMVQIDDSSSLTTGILYGIAGVMIGLIILGANS